MISITGHPLSRFTTVFTFLSMDIFICNSFNEQSVFVRLFSDEDVSDDDGNQDEDDDTMTRIPGAGGVCWRLGGGGLGFFRRCCHSQATAGAGSSSPS